MMQPRTNGNILNIDFKVHARLLLKHIYLPASVFYRTGAFVAKVIS